MPKHLAFLCMVPTSGFQWVHGHIAIKKINILDRHLAISAILATIFYQVFFTIEVCGRKKASRHCILQTFTRLKHFKPEDFKKDFKFELASIELRLVITEDTVPSIFSIWTIANQILITETSLPLRKVVKCLTCPAAQLDMM